MTKNHLKTFQEQVSLFKGKQMMVRKENVKAFLNKSQFFQFKSPNGRNFFYYCLKQLFFDQKQSFCQQQIDSFQEYQDFLSRNLQQASQIQLISKVQSQTKQPLTYLCLNQTIKNHSSKPLNPQSQELIPNSSQKVKLTLDENNQIYCRIVQILKNSNFTEEKWKVFRTELVEQGILKHARNYQVLAAIIIKVLDEDKRSVREIQQLLSLTKQVSIYGKLNITCSKYLEKLNVLKLTHPLIQKRIEPKLKAIHQLIQKTSEVLKQQKRQCCSKLSIQQLKRLYILQKNSNQLHKTQSKFNQYSFKRFHYQKQILRTINCIQKQLDQKTKIFIQNICSLHYKFDDINQFQLNDQLKFIYQLLVFIRARKVALEQENSISYSKQFIQQISSILEKCEGLFKNIKTKLQKISQYQYVQDFQINKLLMVCLIVLKQYQQYYDKYFIQNSAQSLKKLQDFIIMKLKNPFEKIVNIQPIINYNIYNKLLLTLRYLKRLDKVFEKLSISNNFTQTLQFQENTQIRELTMSFLDFILNQSKKYKFLIQLMNYYQIIKYSYDQLQLQAQKQKNINMMNYQILNQAIKFVKCFEEALKIYHQFKNVFILQIFQDDQIDQLLCKRTISSRIQSISSFIHNQYDISRQNLIDIKKQLNFATIIIKKIAGNQRQSTQIQQLRILINQKIKQTTEISEDVY